MIHNNYYCIVGNTNEANLERQCPHWHDLAHKSQHKHPSDGLSQPGNSRYKIDWRHVVHLQYSIICSVVYRLSKSRGFFSITAIDCFPSLPAPCKYFSIHRCVT